MRRPAALAALAILAAGCSSSGIVSRQRQPRRLKTLPDSVLVVAEYESSVAEVPTGADLLLQARADLLRICQRSELFEIVRDDPQALPPEGAVLIRPKFESSYVEVDTGFWRNFFVCASVVGLFLDLNVNQIVTTDGFDVDVLVRTARGYTSVERLVFPVETVYRYTAITALLGSDWAEVQDDMFLAANRNFAVDLTREVPGVLTRAAEPVPKRP